MIRSALTGGASARSSRRSSTSSLPAPVAGWYAGQSIAVMKPKFALTLDNWFPSATEVKVRSGCTAHTTTEAAQAIKTLLSWNGPSATKMFAATDVGIFDVTASGPVPTVESHFITEGKVQYVNFTTVAGHYLVCVNGQDQLAIFNGTSWQSISNLTTPAISGPPATGFLSIVAVLKRRLWFSTGSSLSAWYLPIGSIGGALVEFPFGQIFGRGGHIVAMRSWTLDGGNGSDDNSAFFSSEGEVAIFSGTDPDSAATWRHVGTYYIGEPLGPNSVTQYGGDLLLLSQQGLYPMSRALQSASIDKSDALTNNIDTIFHEASDLYASEDGWQIIVAPSENLVLVNVPVKFDKYHQYVMNSITGAWCRFIGFNARNWVYSNSRLYFCSGKKVFLALEGDNDDGQAIVARVQQAYSYFGTQGQHKHFKLIRPVLRSNSNIELQISLDVDFSLVSFPSYTVSGADVGSSWDGAVWDSAVWGSSNIISRSWVTVAAREGFAASLRMQLASNHLKASWFATDFLYEVGEVI